jgi:hypothetical protein
MNDDVSKDLVFEEPRVPNKYAKEDAEVKTSPRGYWTVAEVEETMWRIRASGGTDSTAVKPERGRHGGMALRAVGVEAFAYPDPTAPPRRPPGDDPRAGHEIPSLLPAADLDPLPKPVYWAAVSAGVLIAVPAVIALILYVWSLLFAVL